MATQGSLSWRAETKTMKRPLRPGRAIPPIVLERIKQHRVVGTTIKRAVRVTSRTGNFYDFLLSHDDPTLPMGAPVYVWWGTAGFVCDAVAEVDAAEASSRLLADQVREAREHFAKARDERRQRALSSVDICL